MGTKAGRLLVGIALSVQVAVAQDEDGFLGIFNANPTLIDSISNEVGTLTSDLSTRSIVGPTENSKWQLEGPVVVSEDGQVLGRLSTVDVATTSLFNETILEQVPYSLRCEACIGSLNDDFSTRGPRIYDSQSATYKALFKEVFEYESIQWKR